MSTVVKFDAFKLRPYVENIIKSHIADPPDSDWQAGFLQAAVVIYREALACPLDDPLYVIGEKLTADYVATKKQAAT